MRIARVLAMASALVLGTSVLAGAQEHGKTGVTIGYPGDIGILWHASDSVAIRPTFTFNHTSSTSAAGSTTDGWGSGFEVSALLYLRKFDNVRTYVSPQFTYSHGSTTSKSNNATTSTITVDTGTNAMGGAGAFGAQYTASAHFAVYGELGVAFSHQKTTFAPSIANGTTTTGIGWGTFAGVGIVFYP